jgi:hypothetical protein
LGERRADVPADLDRIVMKLLAKSPNDRFADGAALVAALDGAPVPAVKEDWDRYGLTEAQRERFEQRMERLPPIARNFIEPIVQQQLEARGQRLSLREELHQRKVYRREEKLQRRARERDDPTRPMSERIRRFHGRIVGYMSTSLFLVGINYVTTGHGAYQFWWCVFPILGMGLGMARSASRLIGDGATAGQLLGGRVPDDQPQTDAALPQSLSPSPALTGQAAALAAGRADVRNELLKGPYGAVFSQAITDRQTVNDLLGRLTATERKMLPEMKETADALFHRIVSLANLLTKLGAEADPARLKSLDERIAAVEQEPGDTGERDRRLRLLKRQRDMIAELVNRRATLLGQYESAGLVLQNMALDLLKVRSSGLDSAINGLTSATKEARALSREIGYVLAANEELKKVIE